jgi:hypothetical protein
MANGTMPSSYQWPNWLNVLLAIWLFISPWVLQYAAVGTAAWNAWVVAIVIAALSIAALAKLAQWEEWVNLALGVWLILSPWILGFSANANAMGNAVIVGIICAILAIFGLMAARRAEAAPRT